MKAIINLKKKRAIPQKPVDNSVMSPLMFLEEALYRQYTVSTQLSMHQIHFKTERIMIQHEAQNNHGDSDAEFLPMEMLALTPLYSGESFSDVNGEMSGVYNEAFSPMPFFALGDSDDEDDDMDEEDDFDDMEEEEFDDDEEEDDFDEDDDEDDDDDEDEEEDDFDEDEDDDYDYDDDDDFEYDEE